MTVDEVLRKTPRREPTARFIESLESIEAVPRPDSVLVGAFRYRIVWDPDEVERWQKKAGGDAAVGLCFNDELTIVINSEETAEQAQRATLLHEIQHACIWASGLHGDTSRKLGQEEFVSRSSAILFGVLRNNPDLLAYLLAD